MNTVMVENLIFCIEKLPSGGHSSHDKNNLLMKLYFLKRNKRSKRFNTITDSAIKFIIKESKKYDI